jgi:hypothetical protein
MSPKNRVLGCAVCLAALAGLIVSNHFVDAAIPLKSPRETSAAARSQPSSDIPVANKGPDNASSEGPVSTGRVCTDLSGGTFGWNWPNIPFGTTTCSDAGRKAGG